MYLSIPNFPYKDICAAEWCGSEKCVTVITLFFLSENVNYLCGYKGRDDTL